ncbi:MAG: DUF3419 family protein [Alphaproteobacteria bacterium]
MKILKHLFPEAFAYKNFSDGKMPVSKIHETLGSNISASWPERLFPHKFAVKYYNGKGKFITNMPTCFSRYSPSYALSNENLRNFARNLYPFGKHVLTVAGAGDQAFWFTKFGALSIDSFDISHCSKIVSELKSAAIKRFDLETYKNFVINLRKNSANLYFSEEYEFIKPILSQSARNFVYEMKGKNFCENGIIKEEYFPNTYEFNLIKTRLMDTKFIWSNIDNLHKKLTKKYDIIYLSNIFQYFTDAEKISVILKTLAEKHLSNDGRIAFINDHFILNKNYIKVAKDLETIGKFKIIEKQKESTLLIFHKTK